MFKSLNFGFSYSFPDNIVSSLREEKLRYHPPKYHARMSAGKLATPVFLTVSPMLIR